MKVGIIALKYEKVGRFKISMPCCLLTVFKERFSIKMIIKNYFLFKKKNRVLACNIFLIIFKNILKHDYIKI